jgi:hypothetical protein
VIAEGGINKKNRGGKIVELDKRKDYRWRNRLERGGY